MADLEKVRAHIFVKGRVQGVGYRWFVEDEANARGLTGWVRNLWDGRVEVVVEGYREVIEDLIRALKAAPPPARVSGVEVEYGEFRGEFFDFRIRFTQDW